MRLSRPLAVSAALTAALLAAAGCGNGTTTTAKTEDSSPAKNATVEVVLNEWQVMPSVAKVSPGEVTFSVANRGTQVHELALLKTDHPHDKLPLDTEGAADEKGPGVELIDEVEDVQPGQTKTFRVAVTPGRYVLVCNLGAHYQNNMHTPFTVE
jgi:uncharacterized cupredoxin-like copper-binding protein